MGRSAQTDAGSVRKPDATLLGLFGGNLQPLAPPDPFYPFVVDDPATGRPQKLCDLSITIAAVLAGEFDNIGGQPIFVFSPLWNTALRRTMLSEHTADASLGQLQFGSNMINACSATRGA